jgi:hypothetical protein
MSKLRGLFGKPDWQIPSGDGPILLWGTDPAKTCSVWAEAVPDGAHRGFIGDVVYRGPIVTRKGDRLGTPLGVVRRHWPGWRLVSAAAVGGSRGPNYGRITRWGSVAFGFDEKKRLAGVAVRASTQFWQPIAFKCLR